MRRSIRTSAHGDYQPPKSVSLLIAACLLFLILGSCGVRSKLTAEEDGYLALIHPLALSTCRIKGGTQADPNERFPLLFKGGFINSHTQTLALWEVNHRWLAVTLPPPGTEELHSALVQTTGTLLRALEQLVQSNDVHPDAWEDLRAKSIEACAQYNSFLSRVRKRASGTEHGSEVVVSFIPPILPVEATLSSEDGFGISLTASVSTPFGTFSGSASDSNRQHAGFLVIRHKGKQRLLALDRSFQLFVPIEYGATFVNTHNALIVDVAAKEADANDSPPDIFPPWPDLLD